MYRGHKKYEDRKLDGRVKIHKDQYEEVRAMYARVKSQAEVAKHYGVDKSAIRWILNPEAYKKFLEAKRTKSYYNKERHKEAVRRYRAKKRSLGVEYQLFNPSK